jgi:Uma2 family endonuclease
MTILSPIAPPTPITPEELLAMPDSVDYELVDGKLVERNMGCESGFIEIHVALQLGSFVFAGRLGYVMSASASYRCFPDDPNKVRRPDVSFISTGRLPGERLPTGDCLIAPNLVVEVVLPNDFSEEVEQKVQEYLAAGVRLVWVVHPSTRTVRVHRQRSSPLGITTDLLESDTITGEDVLPGFSCPVASFFGLK